MKNKILLSATYFVFSLTSFVNAQGFVNVESGGVISQYNNVRIPGNTGTLISLTDDLKAKPNAFFRLRAGYTIKSRHTISLLYAPLTVKSSGKTSKSINYEGAIFPINTNLDASYTFNSYRLTYRYDIVKRTKFEFGIGFTAKIRDAKIQLRNDQLDVSKTNVGFVPIINFRLNWIINDQFGLLFEGDALAAPQGRAEDVLLAGTYKFSDNLMLNLGYRVLEGGADNDEVYNFSMFHYASVGLTLKFNKK
jgi:hypothetical protein